MGDSISSQLDSLDVVHYIFFKKGPLLSPEILVVHLGKKHSEKMDAQVSVK